MTHKARINSCYGFQVLSKFATCCHFLCRSITLGNHLPNKSAMVRFKRGSHGQRSTFSGQYIKLKWIWCEIVIISINKNHMLHISGRYNHVGMLPNILVTVSILVASLDWRNSIKLWRLPRRFGDCAKTGKISKWENSARRFCVHSDPHW